MRDVRLDAAGWTDARGKVWPPIRSLSRLKFKYPMHAAIRATVFARDNYCCVRCGAKAIDVPAEYSGRYTLYTNTKVSSGWPDMLVVDHVLTLKAGGWNGLSNFQTLCETCNRKKQREDRAAIFMKASANA